MLQHSMCQPLTVGVDARDPVMLPRTKCHRGGGGGGGQEELTPHRAVLLVRSNDDLRPVIRVTVNVHVFEPGKLLLSNVSFSGE